MKLTSRSKDSGSIWSGCRLTGQYLDFLLSAKRDANAAERFFRKVLKASRTQSPRVITVDKNAAYPKALEALKADETLPETTQLRQKKYLNNIIEQDHRAIKRLTKAAMGFNRTYAGVLDMWMRTQRH